MSWLGIDIRQFKILLRLFRTLSDRMELTGQLGLDRKAMGSIQIWNVIFGVLLSLIALSGTIPGAAFLAIMLAATVFMITPMLVSEAANAFMNPAEAFVLAHQPIRNRTFVAAKATYIVTATVRIAASLNVVPALAGLRLKDTTPIYPVTHLLAVSLAGIFVALMMCGVFGLLFRFVPISKLRNAARWMQLLIAVIFPLTIQFGRFLPVRSLLPEHLSFSDKVWSAFPPMWFIDLGLIAQPGRPAFFFSYAVPAMLASAAFFVYGARSLSQDYMTRVVSMMRGERTRRWIVSTDATGALVRSLAGQPSGRGSYSFVSKMMFRDWQFRRSMLQGVFPFLFVLIRAIQAGNTLGSPFGMRFAPIHLLPHLLGFILMNACVVMTYSDQHKGAWIFLTFPAHGLKSIARGIYWSLWLPLAGIPHVFALGIGLWLWGPAPALLFTAYSLALTSLYVSVTMKLIEGLPFSSPPKNRVRAGMLPLMIAALTIGGILTTFQYFILFHHMLATLAAALVAAAVAVILAQVTFRGFEVNAIHHLHIIASGRARMFRELEAE